MLALCVVHDRRSMACNGKNSVQYQAATMLAIRALYKTYRAKFWLYAQYHEFARGPSPHALSANSLLASKFFISFNLMRNISWLIALATRSPTSFFSVHCSRANWGYLLPLAIASYCPGTSRLSRVSVETFLGRLLNSRQRASTIGPNAQRQAPFANSATPSDSHALLSSLITLKMHALLSSPLLIFKSILSYISLPSPLLDLRYRSRKRWDWCMVRAFL